MLECVDLIMNKILRRSIKAALEPGAEASTLASAIMLMTGYGDLLRVEALTACKLPDRSMPDSAVHCSYRSCLDPTCRGNVVEELEGGSWRMLLEHTKRGHPHQVEWPCSSRVARLLTAWREFLYSGSVPLPADGVAPLLMNPQPTGGKGKRKELQPIRQGNWASAWQASVATMARQPGMLKHKERELVLREEEGLAILPSTQQQLRHFKSSLKESRLINCSEGMKRRERARLAEAMDTGIKDWLSIYSRGYSFWFNHKDWATTTDLDYKRLIVECALDDAEDVVESARKKKRQRMG